MMEIVSLSFHKSCLPAMMNDMIMVMVEAKGVADDEHSPSPHHFFFNFYKHNKDEDKPIDLMYST